MRTRSNNQSLPIAEPAALQRLARIWTERRTGQIKAVKGPAIDVVDGELVNPSDLPRLRAALREPKLRWREKDIPGVGVPLLGALLLREASRLEAPAMGKDMTLEFRHTSRLELSGPTTDWIFAGGRVEDLIRLSASDRATVKRDVGALMNLGLCAVQTISPQERRERQWLQAEFKRVRRADDERELVGVGPLENRQQVLFVAQKKVERCLELRDMTNDRRVQQMANQVAGAVMSAAKAICA